MTRRYYLSTFFPNDPDPAFFDSVERLLDRFDDRAVVLRFVEERDLSPQARLWLWSTEDESTTLRVLDDLTVGAREIVLDTVPSALDWAHAAVNDALSLETYEEALARSQREPNVPLLLLRACSASPRPPTKQLVDIVRAALQDSNDEMRYRAISAAVTLQCSVMRDALRERLEHEQDEELRARVRAAVRSYEHARATTPRRDGSAELSTDHQTES